MSEYDDCTFKFFKEDHKKFKNHCKNKCKLCLTPNVLYWIYDNICIGTYDWNDSKIHFNDTFAKYKNFVSIQNVQLDEINKFIEQKKN
jgi:hypothetical protein